MSAACTSRLVSALHLLSITPIPPMQSSLLSCEAAFAATSLMMPDMMMPDSRKVMEGMSWSSGAVHLPRGEKPFGRSPPGNQNQTSPTQLFMNRSVLRASAFAWPLLRAATRPSARSIPQDLVTRPFARPLNGSFARRSYVQTAKAAMAEAPAAADLRDNPLITASLSRVPEATHHLVPSGIVSLALLRLSAMDSLAHSTRMSKHAPCHDRTRHSPTLTPSRRSTWCPASRGCWPSCTRR